MRVGWADRRTMMVMQVAIRAFFPVWVWLYVLQFLLWPLIARDNWYASSWQSFLASMADTNSFLRVSTFFGNTLYLVALGYYTIICFLGYNGKPAIFPSNQIPNS